MTDAEGSATKQVQGHPGLHGTSLKGGGGGEREGREGGEEEESRTH